MTPDDALAAVLSAYPLDGDWAGFRARRHAGEEALAVLTGEGLRGLVPRLLESLATSNDIEVQRSLAVPLARATVELGEPPHFVTVLAQSIFSQPYLRALDELGKRGCDTWPLVAEVMARAEVKAEDTRRALADYFARHPDDVAHFEKALARAPGHALQAVWGTSYSGKPHEAFLPAVSTVLFAAGAGDELRIEALQLLRASRGLDDALVARIETLWPAATGPFASALAAFFAKRAVQRRQVPTAFLSDRRPEVRRAAFDAFISRDRLPRSVVPVVVAGWADPDEPLRATAERVLRELTRGEGLTPEELAPIAALLSPERDDVAAFLAWAAVLHPTIADWCLQQLPAGSKLYASLSAKHSLACAACGPLGTGTTWNHEASAPKAREALEYVASLGDDLSATESMGLWRCARCFAHFTLYEQSEIDVNSRHDSWSLSRLTLHELRGRYGALVDTTGPRFAHWLEAAQSDLTHVDPKVRELAKWELAPPPVTAR